MEAQYYLQLVARRWWIIVLTGVLTAAAAFGFTRLQPDEYTAAVKVIILSRPDFGQAQAARELLHTYASRFNSTLRMAEVIDELKLDMMPAELLGQVHVGVSTDSNIITVEVENSNSELAYRIADSLALGFIRWRDQDNANFPRADQIRAEKLDDPQISKEGSVLINTLAGFILGTLLGSGLVAVLEWRDARYIRNTREAETLLEIPIVGTIPVPAAK
jgi:capsular polysaccharide biosynthesis protein